MGKEIKNKFNESINKIKDNINNIDEKDIKKENIEILEIDEARRQGDESLLSITNEARSLIEISLLDFGSLSFGKVSTEFTK